MAPRVYAVTEKAATMAVQEMVLVNGWWVLWWIGSGGTLGAIVDLNRRNGKLLFLCRRGREMAWRRV
jgi:hypothetical protein